MGKTHVEMLHHYQQKVTNLKKENESLKRTLNRYESNLLQLEENVSTPEQQANNLKNKNS